MKSTKMHDNWNSLAEEDAKWAILTDPTKKKNRWEDSDFFETGKRQVKADMDRLRSMNIELNFDRALDFGCGIGRLSQALATHFKEVHGVDVSSHMIKQAEERNPCPDRVKYFVNVANDLTQLNDFEYDLVYSWICLQHIPTDYQRMYLTEFIRLMRRGGAAMFQVQRAISWRKFVPDFVVEIYRTVKHGENPFIPTYGIVHADVRKIIETNGCVLKDYQIARPENKTDRWALDTYIIVKP